MATTMYLRWGSGSGFYVGRSVLGDTRPDNYTTTPLVDNSTSGANNLGALLTDAGTISYNLAPGTTNGPVTDPGINEFAFYSPPLASDVTISGSIAVDVWAYESSMSANATISAVLWRIRPDGTTDLMCSGTYGTELTTSNAQVTITMTPTSTDCHVGDIFMLGVYIDDYSGGNMGLGYYVYIYVNGAEGATSDSQIRFTETLSFISSAPSGTTAYLLDAASDVAGAGKLKAWTDSAGSQASKVVNATSAPTRAQWTATAGGQTIEWYTPQLQAVTIAGLMWGTFYISTTNQNCRTAPVVKIYKTDSDGSNPVQIGHGRGQAVENTPLTSRQWRGIINGTLTDGQRLLIRVYAGSGYWGSNYEYLSVQSASGNPTVTISLNDTTRTAITFPVTLLRHGPLVDTLTDDFSTKDETKWDWQYGTGYVSSGKLYLSDGNILVSRDEYELTGSSCYIDWGGAPTSGDKRLYLSTKFSTGGGFAEGATLLWVESATGYLRGGYYDTGYNFHGATTTFNATTMKYGRIRESGGTVYWEYSSDASSWNTLWSSSVASIEADLGYLDVVTVVVNAAGSNEAFEGISVTSGGAATVEASVSFSAAASLSATGAITLHAATLAVSAAATLTAVGNVPVAATLSVSAASTFTPVAYVTRPATVAFTAAATFTAVGTVVKQGSVTMSAAAAFTLAAYVVRFATVSYAATSTFTAIGVATTFATVTYTAAFGFTAVGEIAGGVVQASLAVAAAASLAVAGYVVAAATVSVTAAATFTAVGVPEKQGALTVSASASLTIVGVVEKPASVSMSAAATLTVVAFVLRPATVTYSAASTFTAVGFVTVAATLSVSASATFTAVGALLVTYSLSCAAVATFTAVGTVIVIVQASVSMSATATFSAVGFVVVAATLSVTSAATFTAVGLITRLGIVTFSSAATLTVAGFVTLFATLAYAAVSTFTAEALAWRFGVYKPNGLASMSGLSGTYQDIDDSPDAPDGNALTPTGGPVAVRITFEDHGYELRTGAGDQILRVLVHAL